MRSRSSLPVVLGGALLATTMLTPAVLAQKGPGDPEAPVTLALLVQDVPGRQSEAAANDLVDLAQSMSGGAITIVPTFDGGDVAHAVMAGETPLGMVPSREWDGVGVTSLDVFEAPLLIDNDALAKAVATSDMATGAMAGLGAVGVTGLALWPEDLRHLFSIDASGVRYDSPESVADTDVVVPAGQPGKDFITTLGGTVYQEGVASGDLTGDRAVDADAGTLEGIVTGLWGAGLPSDAVTVAGDLVVYSKYQMLVANSAALAGLSAHQRDLLGQIVAAAQQRAIDRHFAEADLAASLCAAGATVFSAGPDAIAAFRAATQPLTDRLAADPVTGPLMASVQALKDQTPASPGAGECSPPPASPSPVASAAPDGSVASLGPPAGVYRLALTREELAAHVSPEDAAVNAGIWTWTIGADGTHSLQLDSGAFTADQCHGTYRADGDAIRFDYVSTSQCSGWERLVVTAAGDGVDTSYEGCWDACPVDAVMFSRHWTRIGDVPAAAASPAVVAASPAAAADGYVGDQLPPNGVYRASMTVDDLVAAGSSRNWAGPNAGTWDWTFRDGEWAAVRGKEHCSGTMELEDGAVLTVDRASVGCGMAYRFLWRPESDGISIRLRDLPDRIDPTESEMRDGRAFLDRTWVRVADAPSASTPLDGFIGDQLVPPGTYRVTVGQEDLVAAGSSVAAARGNAGTWDWTFTDSGWSAQFGNQHCAAGMSLGDGVVVLERNPDAEPCTLAYDLRWRPEDDGIRLQVLDLNWTTATPQLLADERALTERVWSRVP
ncbi:MAG: hypothetical protein U0869_02500 [Chloroflexota bacterium]